MPAAEPRCRGTLRGRGGIPEKERALPAAPEPWAAQEPASPAGSGNGCRFAGHRSPTAAATATHPARNARDASAAPPRPPLGVAAGTVGKLRQEGGNAPQSDMPSLRHTATARAGCFLAREIDAIFVNIVGFFFFQCNYYLFHPGRLQSHGSHGCGSTVADRPPPAARKGQGESRGPARFSIIEAAQIYTGKPQILCKPAFSGRLAVSLLLPTVGTRRTVTRLHPATCADPLFKFLNSI